ncbi:MAG TPA: DUF1206 domain-containing protein [Gaiellales bacterium]|nr:DUF1206 domain-containing protein [Gaiellales bacterium]
MNTTISTDVRSEGRRATRSPAFEALARVGFVARGVIYGTIGLLAIQVAIHSSNEKTNQRGAMQTIQQQPFGHGLLIAVAIGLGGYALWRFVQAAYGNGPEGGGDSSTSGRIVALASGLSYTAMCALAVGILLGSSSSSGNAHSSTAGVLSWPGGQWIVGAAGAIFIGVALYQGYKGISRKFLEEDKTEKMGPTALRWITIIGVVGHLARMAAFGLIGVFVVKAAIDYAPKKAVGLDGALAKLAHQSYGTALLLVVAAGLVAFGVYSIADARYRRI